MLLDLKVSFVSFRTKLWASMNIKMTMIWFWVHQQFKKRSSVNTPTNFSFYYSGVVDFLLNRAVPFLSQHPKANRFYANPQTDTLTFSIISLLLYDILPKRFQYKRVIRL